MNRKQYIKILTVISLTMLLLITVSCAIISKKKLLTQQQRQLNIESFDDVWTTIRDKYYDPDLGGLDWKAIRDELRPQIEQATTMRQARAVMRDMISRLGQSHFNIIPTNVYENLGNVGKGAYGGVTGIDACIIDGHAYVSSVFDESPAAKAGVQSGWEIVSVEKDTIISILPAIAKEFEGKTWNDGILVSAVESRLSGKIGDSISVQFLDENNHSVNLKIPLSEKRGRRYKLGHLPNLYVWIEVDTLDDNIGYIAFNHFLDPVHLMPQFNDAIKSFMNVDGIIIDLRSNGGGMGQMAMGMAGWFIPDDQKYLGTMSTRNNQLKLTVFPRPTTYNGPLAILVNELSGSASEFFAGGLQDLGRARIFGSRTMGAALPSVIEKLPNGDGFQYVMANYTSQGGEVLEGKGVIPDFEVYPTRQALLQGRDLVLEAAVEWIRRQ